MVKIDSIRNFERSIKYCIWNIEYGNSKLRIYFSRSGRPLGHRQSAFTQPTVHPKPSFGEGDELDLYAGECGKVKLLIVKGLGNQQIQHNPCRVGLLLLETEKQSYD